MNAAKNEADIAYAVYVVESIEHGIADAEKGDLYTGEEVRSRVLGRLRARA